MQPEKLDHLLQRYLDQQATPAETGELFELLQQSTDDAIKASLGQRWAQFTTDQEMPDAGRVFEGILRDAKGLHKETATLVRMSAWKRIAVAASVVGLLLMAGYWLIGNKRPAIKDQKEMAVAEPDVKAPGVNRAMIRLANGQIVYLDSAANGMLSAQGNVKIIKLGDGQIRYEGNSTAPVYNTLTNPRGSKVIDMTLADGSKLWLNAGSSVTYPVTFTGNERRLSMTGEAYFEIAHDASKPFYVSKGDVQVQVLGTHFNVNAYDDEPGINVTLLEGAVEVKNQHSKAKIAPGQQVMITGNGQLAINKEVDVEQVMAWKNNLFSFKNADIQPIMREVARWYDVEVEFENGGPSGRFSGDIGRGLSLQELLHVLDDTKVKYRIEGKKLILVK